MKKKLNNKNIKVTIGLVLFITLNFAFIPSNLTPMKKSFSDLLEVKSSGVSYDVTIDDLPGSLTNWSWAATQPWFGGGSGTELDPYIIEDEIFTYGSGNGEPFRVFNSRKHFIVRNCSFVDSDPSWAGIFFNNVTNGDILDNEIVFNGYGIVYIDVNDTIISNNYISIYSDFGIWLFDDCNNNIINGNTVNGNGGDYGIALDSNTDNNLIYENYVSDHGTDNAIDHGTNNHWNNTVIGNYWGDYPGYDMDLDGIGDDPYSINGGAGNFDFLPIWNLQPPIAIDDLPSSLTNWSWAETQPWFGGGSGTELDPYIIENMNIDGGTNCIAIENSRRHFIIQQCTLSNSGGSLLDAGLYLSNVTNAIIIDNDCTANYNGIYLEYSYDNIISENTANIDNIVGIRLNNSDNNIISGNTANNNDDTGIYIFQSNNITISGNTANDNDDTGIFLEESNNNTISGNIICNNETLNQNRGIYLEYYCNNNILSGNTARNNTYIGIALTNNCDDNTISGNTAHDNDDYGFYLDTCDNNTISGNLANGNGFVGIHLNGLCDNNTILGNTANNNAHSGIYFDGSDKSNDISGNTAHNNTYTGIHFESDNDYNTISGNILSGSMYGINIGNSANNTIYGNIFRVNGIHAMDNGTENKWNSTTIGNYWNNHTGPDTSPVDGIVDTPYSFIEGSAGSFDYLPIAEDGPPSVVINTPSEFDVFSVVSPSFNVTITDNLLDETWYDVQAVGFVSLDNPFVGSTGTIEQSIWDSIPDGIFVLTFYASDLALNIGWASVNIDKDTLAPLIVISSPITDETSDATAPSFVVEISDSKLGSMWYSLDGGTTNYLFTVNGTIDQTAWTALEEGTVTITFYANDTVGNLSFLSVDVVKDLPSPPPPGGIPGYESISLISTMLIATALLTLSLIKRNKLRQ